MICKNLTKAGSTSHIQKAPNTDIYSVWSLSNKSKIRLPFS